MTIQDKETEALVAKIASLTRESEAEAVRIAARERVERLELEGGVPKPRAADDPRRSPEAFRHWLEAEIWSLLPLEALDRPPTMESERAEFLGYGPDGT